MSKFSEFITDKKIDPRRILSASASIEKLQPEDRALRLAQRVKTDKKEEGERKKPRSGRPITQRAMNALLEGKPISGPQKTRLLRALNAVLEKKKHEPATLKALF